MKLMEFQARLDQLSTSARSALVIGGYLAALIAAWVALISYVHITSGPDRNASSGMYAFADAMFFLSVLAAGSLAPTTLLLYFLRKSDALWRVFGSLVPAVAITGWLAVGDIAEAWGGAGFWSMLAVPRVFVAPLLAGLFLLVGMFSPNRASQRWLFAATAIESITSVYGVIHWFVPALVR